MANLQQNAIANQQQLAALQQNVAQLQQLEQTILAQQVRIFAEKDFLDTKFITNILMVFAWKVFDDQIGFPLYFLLAFF